MVISDIPENRKQWRHEAPETLMNLLAAAHLTSSSFSTQEGEFGMYFILKNITSPLGSLSKTRKCRKGIKEPLAWRKNPEAASALSEADLLCMSLFQMPLTKDLNSG